MTEHYAGLEVGVAETAICVVDLKGEVRLETTVATEPDLIAQTLAPWRATQRRAGHEAGALSPWLKPALKDLGVPATCLETATCGRRCRPSATRPTRRTPWGWPI